MHIITIHLLSPRNEYHIVHTTIDCNDVIVFVWNNEENLLKTKEDNRSLFWVGGKTKKVHNEVASEIGIESNLCMCNDELEKVNWRIEHFSSFEKWFQSRPYLYSAICGPKKMYSWWKGYHATTKVTGSLPFARFQDNFLSPILSPHTYFFPPLLKTETGAP